MRSKNGTKPRLTLKQLQAIIAAESIYTDSDNLKTMTEEQVWRMTRTLYEIIRETL